MTTPALVIKQIQPHSAGPCPALTLDSFCQPRAGAL